METDCDILKLLFSAQEYVNGLKPFTPCANYFLDTFHAAPRDLLSLTITNRCVLISHHDLFPFFFFFFIAFFSLHFLVEK